MDDKILIKPMRKMSCTARAFKEEEIRKMQDAKKAMRAWTIATLAVLAIFCTWRLEIGRKGQIMLLLGGSAMTAVLLGINRAIARKERKPEQLFLMLFIPISLAMMTVLPLFRAPDEMAHLGRIWQISIGQWIPDERNAGGFYQPLHLFEEASPEITLWRLAKTAGDEIDMNQLEEADVGAATGFYPIHNYFPQALGMALVRLATKNKLAILYGARFGGWLATLLLLYAAVKKIPAGKYLMIAISLMPMFLQEAVSASADGMTNAAAAAFLAMILEIRAGKGPLKKRQYAEMLLLTFCVCTFKMFYCPLALLLLTIPAERFSGGRKEKRRVLGMIMAAILAVIGLWALISLKNYVVPSASEGNRIIDQAKWIAEHPIQYLAVLGRTILDYFGNFIREMEGQNLSWYNIYLPSLLTSIQIGLVALIAMRDEGLKETEKMRKNILLLSAVSVLIICTSLYVWWTPAGSSRIVGLQGRYFLPLMPGVIMAGMKKDEIHPTNRAEQTVMKLAMTDIWAIAFVFLSTVV